VRGAGRHFLRCTLSPGGKGGEKGLTSQRRKRGGGSVLKRDSLKERSRSIRRILVIHEEDKKNRRRRNNWKKNIRYRARRLVFCHIAVPRNKEKHLQFRTDLRKSRGYRGRDPGHLTSSVAAQLRLQNKGIGKNTGGAWLHAKACDCQGVFSRARVGVG